MTVVVRGRVEEQGKGEGKGAHEPRSIVTPPWTGCSM